MGFLRVQHRDFSPETHAQSPGCTTLSLRGKEPGLGRPMRRAGMHPHPHFSDYHLEQKKMLCMGLLYQSPRSPQPSNRPGLGGALHSYTSRKGLTGSAWRPAATEAYCSPASILPLIQEDRRGVGGGGSPFKRARSLSSPGYKPDRREGERRKRKLALRGLGHGCHRRVSAGFRGKGELSPARPPGGRQPSSGSQRALILRL